MARSLILFLIALASMPIMRYLRRRALRQRIRAVIERDHTDVLRYTLIASVSKGAAYERCLELIKRSRRETFIRCIMVIRRDHRLRYKRLCKCLRVKRTRRMSTYRVRRVTRHIVVSLVGVELHSMNLGEVY